MPEKPYLAIIDYGHGNIHSAANAFRKVLADTGQSMDVVITDKGEEILAAERIVLPGQGAFESCMKGLQEEQTTLSALEEAVLKKGRPFLGICVGMQLLAGTSHEYGHHQGLGWIDGDIVKIGQPTPDFKLPHMGWNRLDFKASAPQDNRHPVLKSVRPESYFYFVHSFMFKCKNNIHALAYSDYGGPIEAVVGVDNIIGMQFHPEKSHETGLRLLEDFIHWRP